MQLISLKNKKSFLNLFSDFILKKIGDDFNTIIKVIDVENFIIVKGQTDYKEILDLSEIKIEFNKKYESTGFQINNTIDLISYNSKLTTKKEINLTLFNSENCSYHSEQISMFKSNLESSFDFDTCSYKIEEDDILYSEFPHGYSFEQGRGLYYYLKHITYSIPSNLPYMGLNYKFSANSTSSEFNLKVTELYNLKELDSLSSAILDIFDFNLSKMKKEFKNFNLENEVLNPLEEHEFLKKIAKDFIIL